MPTLLQSLLVFALLGPLFGYLTFMLLLVLKSADNVTDILRLPLAIVLAAPVGLPLAWVMGSIPAILVGVVYWALRSKTEMRRFSVCLLCAAFAAMVCAGAAVIYDGDLAGLREGGSWLVFIVPGVVATMLSTILIERALKRSRRPPRIPSPATPTSK